MDREKEKELIRLYEKEELSCRQVGERLGVTRGFVNYYLKKWGIKLRDQKEMQHKYIAVTRGEDHPRWQGGRKLCYGPNSDQDINYWTIHKPDHPYAPKQGYVMEHRLVMEEKLGRYLNPKEIVHHINGDTLDNRPENLELVNRSSHVHEHFAHGEKLMARIRELEAQIKRLEEKIRKKDEEIASLKAKLPERFAP